MESKGVIYYNRGELNLVRLVVSLMTLRRHYSGNVTVFLEEKHREWLPGRLRDSFGVNVVYRPDIRIETGTLVHKIKVSQDTPYDLSVWIDSDTVIVGGFGEIFEMARDCDLVVTPYVDYKSDSKDIRRRMESFRKRCPEYVATALSYGPQINTGVYAWKKDSAIFQEWLELATWGDHRTILADEVSCQILLPRYNIRVAPNKFNVIANHMERSEDDRIIHYCNKDHCGQFPLCKLWMDCFTEALRKDVCGIRELSRWQPSKAPIARTGDQ
jgi:hypothetical protein